MTEFAVVTTRDLDRFSEDDFAEHIEAEIARARRLYDQRVFRTLWGREGRKGVVILMEAESLEAARALWDSMPFVQKKMVRVEIYPLVSYWGFAEGGAS
jgi:muconolactone delta-isomerase